MLKTDGKCRDQIYYEWFEVGSPTSLCFLFSTGIDSWSSRKLILEILIFFHADKCIFGKHPAEGINEIYCKNHLGSVLGFYWEMQLVWNPD